MAHDTANLRLTSIVAIDVKGAIGCRNALPWSLKSDMAFFRRQTTGNAVIMGRKTYESIGGPLPKRQNIVLSHNNVLFNDTPECKLALSVNEALFQATECKVNEVFVIGGAQTYAQFSELVERYLVTVVRHEAHDADAFLNTTILTNFADWGGQLLESFPSSDGRDQYAFDIFEMTPPNVEERRDMQASAIERYRSQLSRKVVLRKHKANPILHHQQAFSFSPT
jgi:dihydrofolate reductase